LPACGAGCELALREDLEADLRAELAALTNLAAQVLLSPLDLACLWVVSGLLSAASCFPS